MWEWDCNIIQHQFTKNRIPSWKVIKPYDFVVELLDIIMIMVLEIQYNIGLSALHFRTLHF